MCLMKKNSDNYKKSNFFSEESIGELEPILADTVNTRARSSINEVTVFGCGGHDIYEKEIVKLENKELKVAAYNTEEMVNNIYSGDFSRLISQQLKSLGLDVNIDDLYKEQEQQAFSIFLLLATADLGENPSSFQTLANTILILSKRNYIFEQSFSRLWVSLFSINDYEECEIIAWAEQLSEVNVMCMLKPESTREHFYAVLYAQVEEVGVLNGLDSPRYLDMLESYNEVLSNHCFFPLM